MRFSELLINYDEMWTGFIFIFWDYVLKDLKNIIFKERGGESDRNFNTNFISYKRVEIRGSNQIINDRKFWIIHSMIFDGIRVWSQYNEAIEIRFTQNIQNKVKWCTI